MPSELRGRRSEIRDHIRVEATRDVKDRSTGPMDKFVEPVVASQASFADQHAHAHPTGVLENMLPLGEAPSARMKAKLKLDGARRSTAGRNTLAGGDVATPEGTPQPTTSSQTEMDTLAPPIVTMTVVDDTRDGDYAPNGGSQRSTRPQRTRKRKQRTPTPEREDTPPELQRTRLPEGGTWTDSEIRSIVAQAKSQAHEKGEPESAVYVEELYQMSRKNERLHYVLVRVLSQIAVAEETKEFEKFIRLARPRVKRAAKRAASLQAANSSQTTQPNHTTTRKEPPVAQVNTASTTQNKHNSRSTPTPTQAKTRAASHTSQDRGSQKAGAHPPRIILGSPVVVEPKNKSASAGVSKPLSQEEFYEKTAELSRQLSALDREVNGRPGVGMSRTATPSIGVVSPPQQDITIDEPRPNGEPNAAPEGQTRERAAARRSREASRATLAVPQSTNKRSSTDADLEEREQDRELNAKKQKLSADVVRQYNYKDSFERSVVVSPPPRLRSSTRLNGTPSSLKKRRSNFLASDDDDEDSDLTSPAMTPPPPPPQIQAAGKKAKTKHSPEKRQLHHSGSLLGVRNARIQDSQPADDGRSEAEASENQDYCSACGGHGELLCCDGCSRAFHFECIDPPLSPESKELQEPWFCNVCKARRSLTEAEPERQVRQLFAPLLSYLDKINPESFVLPQEVRDFYEGVTIDEDGHYLRANRNGKNKINGAGEVVDPYKYRDAKGQVLFCYFCKGTSEHDRLVVQCDECAELWHLDCLDPPLASLPNIDADGRKAREWLCPLHSEHELRRVETRRLFASRQSRKIQVRRPRRARTMETALTRGAPNNGLIEVADDSSSDEEEFFLEEDPHRDDVILKVPASGIKLDFISAIKGYRVQRYRDSDFTYRLNADGYGKAISRNTPQPQRDQRFTATQDHLKRHSLRDQQTAFSLAQFAQAESNRDLALGGDGVDTLLAAVLAEAPTEVVDNSDAAFAQARREDLLRLQQLIARQLETIA